MALVVIASTLVTYWAGLRVLHVLASATGHREAIAKAGQVLATLTDAETGQRGYIITGDETYLQPYTQALARVPMELSQLTKVMDVSAEDVERIRQLTRAKLDELRETIALRRNGFDAAAAVVRGGNGRRTMEELRTALVSLQAQQEAALQAEAQVADRVTRTRTMIFVLVGLVNLLFLLWAYRRIAAAVRAREVALATARSNEEEVIRQKDLLSVTLTSIGDCVIVTDADGQITFLNGAAEKLTGWKNSEAIGQPLDTVVRLINEQTREPVVNPGLQSLAEGAVVGLANHSILVTKDGREIPIDDSAAPIRSKDNEIVGCVLVFRDVTEPRRAAHALGLSEARKAAILATALDGIVTINHEGKIIEFNPAAEQTFGYTRDEVLGQEMAELIVPASHRERHYRGLAHYLATGEGPVLNKRIEMPALRAGGQVFPIELTITAIQQDGPPFFTAYIRDITEIKRLEERRTARLAVTQILAEAATIKEAAPQILQAICNNLHWDAGVLWERDGQENSLRCIEVWHRPSVSLAEFEAMTREHQFAPGVGLPGRILSRGEPTWIPDVVKDANFPRARTADREGLHGAFGVPLMLGSHCLGVIEFFSHEIRKPDADLLEMTKTIGSQVADFMERKRAEARLRELATDLSEADERKNEFLAMLAHELRNPLAPLRNALQLVQLSGARDQTTRTAAEIMDRQTAQLVRLVDDLLDVDRISRGKIELRREPVELAAIIEHAVETSRPAIDSGKHTLTVTLPEEPIYLHADRMRLSQAFGNLLNNSCKYSEPGSRIWVNAERQGSSIVVSVKDTGLGIPREMLSAVFEMFTQVHRSLNRSQGGLGIGLALVKRLVELHNGTVTAFSEGPGRGSEFVVRLPITETQKPQPAEPVVLREQTAKTQRILIVDDNKDSVATLAKLLKLTGYEIEIAYDGYAALEAADRFRPDVLLLDIGLPQLDGYETARRIRKESWGKKITLVALTGWGQEEARQKSRAAGFDSHLVKPIDYNQLIKLLGSLAKDGTA